MLLLCTLCKMSQSACRQNYASSQPLQYEQSSPKVKKPQHQPSYYEPEALARVGSAASAGPVRSGIADKVEQAKQKVKAQGSSNLGPSSRLAATVAGPIKAKKQKVMILHAYCFAVLQQSKMYMHAGIRCIELVRNLAMCSSHTNSMHVQASCDTWHRQRSISARCCIMHLLHQLL